jgi:hypothetical protein
MNTFKALKLMAREKRALLIFVIVCSFMSYAAPVDTRVIRGTVVTDDGQPVEGAAVQLTDLVTMAIRSYITNKDGKFEFYHVLTNQGYEVQAHYGDHWGDTKTVTRFDSSKVIQLTLTLDMKNKGGRQ